MSARAAAARWTIVELLHPIPSLLTTVVAVAIGLLFGLTVRDARIWWLGAIMLLVQFSISALNDWADADLDASSGRRRPIPLGVLPKNLGFAIAAGCGAVALALSAISGFGSLALLLVVVGIGSGWAYDLWLKPTILSFVPFAIAFPSMVIWVGVVAGRTPTSLASVFLAGIPLAIAIHLADAIPDVRADRAAQARTLAVVLGRPAADYAAGGLLLVGTIVALVVAIEHSREWGVVLLPAAAFAALIAAISERIPGVLVVGKWIVIAAASLVALILVLVLSGR